MRLQDTYKLDTHALAEGELLGKKYSRQLTGNQSADNKVYNFVYGNIVYSGRLLGTWPPIVQQRRSLPHCFVDGRSVEQVGRRVEQNCHSRGYSRLFGVFHIQTRYRMKMFHLTLAVIYFVKRR